MSANGRKSSRSKSITSTSRKLDWKKHQPFLQTITPSPIIIKVKRAKRRGNGVPRILEKDLIFTFPRSESSTITKELVIRLVRLTAEELRLWSPAVTQHENSNWSSIANFDDDGAADDEEWNGSKFCEIADDVAFPKSKSPTITKELVIRLVRLSAEELRLWSPAVAQPENSNWSSIADFDDDGVADQEEWNGSKFYEIADLDIDDAKKLEITDSVMDLEKMPRFQCYLHSGLNFRTVRSIMQRISMQGVDDLAVWIMCDLVKDHVEGIVNTALDFDEASGEKGPISPIAIIAAGFKAKLELRNDDADAAETDQDNVN